MYERVNWLIHLYYVQQNYTECEVGRALYVHIWLTSTQKIIEQQLAESHGSCEYALFIKGALLPLSLTWLFLLLLSESIHIHAGMILRQRGQIGRSLEMFQAAMQVNPSNINNLKQVARSL